jgi:putative hydrolase of the HAD superfamily
MSKDYYINMFFELIYCLKLNGIITFERSGPFMTERIKSVIFDWGGVLIEDPAPGLVRYCAQALSVSKEEYEKAYRQLSENFQKNLISEETFWERISNELKVPRPRRSSLWTDAFKAVYIPRKEIFTLAAELKVKGYKTAVLSNTEVPAMQYFHELGYDIFDVPVFSCAEGTAKPQREIFEITLAKLDCMPEQAVFIDDNPEFINAAIECGLNAILFEGTEKTNNKLAEIGVK